MTLNVDEQKRLAAVAAVDELIKPLLQSQRQKRLLLGIGSGSTIIHVATRLKQLMKSNLDSDDGGNLDLICVPTSFQAKQLILENGLNLGSLEQFPELDLDIDGADEVDSHLNCIKGGGGCLTQEKILAYASKMFVVICDESKNSTFLSQHWKNGIPVEVIPLSYTMVQLALKEKFTARECNLRMAVRKAGPVVTDNGNFILDVIFDEDKLKGNANVRQLEEEIRSIAGVVCTGLFVQMANKVFFGRKDGVVLVKERNSAGEVVESVL